MNQEFIYSAAQVGSKNFGLSQLNSTHFLNQELENLRLRHKKKYKKVKGEREGGNNERGYDDDGE